MPSTKPALPQIEARELRTFHARLAKWYALHGRHALPWRQTRDAYRIWVSEVMLQQTQVATVRDTYYGPFLERFPTVATLAAAPREKVLKAWEGLGYYRRAGYLHEAAKAAANGLPENEEGLRALPGIGRNTARAILAFAHERPVAILEANVKRVVARIFALATPKEDELWAGAETLLDAAHPFDYNQAMMDLGAQICTPKEPDCAHCPAHGICAGKASPESYPAPKAKKRTPVRNVTLLVLEDADGRLYLESRKDALLGGLYGFVQAPADAASLTLEKKKILLPREPIGRVTHTYSHFRLEGDVRHVRLKQPMRGRNWYTLASIARLPLSRLDHKVLTLLSDARP